MTTEELPEGERAVGRFVSVAELLDTPRLARIYTHVLTEGPVTVGGISEGLDIPVATVYQDVDRLDALGVIDRNRNRTPQQLTAHSFTLTVMCDDATFEVSPALIAAVGHSETDEDIEVFVERHGVPKLAAAVDAAIDHHAGKTTQRMAAERLHVHTIEGMMIVDALGDVFADVSEFDSRLDCLRRRDL